jgi:chromate transporter
MMKDWMDLLWTFFRMGCVTFGGGYAMLPVIERELVRKKGWATMEEVTGYFALGQVTPGVIAVNVSTFIGYKRKGVLGGILATLGFVFPSLMIITIIAAFLRNFADLPPVSHAFTGIRVAVGALILDAVIRLFRTSVKNAAGLIICLAAFGISVFLTVSPAFVIIAAGLAGFFLYRPRDRRSAPAAPSAKPAPGEEDAEDGA